MKKKAWKLLHVSPKLQSTIFNQFSVNFHTVVIYASRLRNIDEASAQMTVIKKNILTNYYFKDLTDHCQVKCNDVDTYK